MQERQWRGSAGGRGAGRDGCTDGTAAAAAPPGEGAAHDAAGDVSGLGWQGWVASFPPLLGALGRLEEVGCNERGWIWGPGHAATICTVSHAWNIY